MASLNAEVAQLKAGAPAQPEAKARISETVLAERDSLAAQVASLTNEVAQLKSSAATQTDAQSQAAALANERNSLAARLTALEGNVASAQAEAARANQALAALQRSTAQSTNELAPGR